MAVAAADFYSYARATGTPLPKTKQEEAKLTPAVNQWKNNQLRRDNQGQEGINPGAVAGLTGLAGVGALALAATRGGLRQRVTEAVKPSPGSRVSTGVGGLQQDLGKVTKGRGDTWGEYKESIAPKTKVDERDFVNEAIAKVEADAIKQSSIGDYTPQELAVLEAEKRTRERIREGGEQVRQRIVKGLEVPEPSWEQTDVVQSREPKVTAVSPKQVLALPPATGLQETKGSTALSSNDFLQQQGPNKYKYIDPEDVTLSPGGNVPKSETINDQTLNAIDAAEDQQTGRVNQQLQRNEDLDQSQIAVMEEIAEDQDRRFGQGLESGEIAPGREYQAPIDEVAESLPDGAPVIQSEQRLGVAKEQDFVQQALAKTRPTYAEELTSEDLSALRGIDTELKEIRSQGQPKFYENRNINLNRISNAPKIKTGTFLDNAVSNLPSVVVAADEIARRGVKDIGDAVKGVKKVVVENAPSNLPDLSRVPTSGTNTNATVQLSDGSTAGPLYPFRQLVRGLTGDESVDVVTPRPNAQEFLDKTKGEIIRVEGPQGQVRYAETKSDPSWVGAKSDIPTNTPVPGPDLSQTELSRVLQRQRYEIASNLRKQGKPITSGRIESELQKFYGPKSYDYVRNELRKTNVRDYTKRKHALQLGATYDPKFFDDVDLPSVQLAGETISVNPERRYTKKIKTWSSISK